ncbi:hypothetical protein [Hufsiella arboris]|nr:hypothetical protein [Hufsiella arboris]
MFIATGSLSSCKKDSDFGVVDENVNGSFSKNSLATVNTAAVNQNLIFGINGHPLDLSPSYRGIGPYTQINLVTSMGMNWYRFDIVAQSSGIVTVPYLFRPIHDAAVASGVNILPVVYPRTLNLNSTEAVAYQAGKLLATNFAKQNGQYFTHYELGNELGIKLVLPGKTGQSQSHFDPAKIKAVAAYLKGMDEGIKATDPGAKTMVDASWLRYGYLKYLETYGVKFDIIAYHWYNNCR